MAKGKTGSWKIENGSSFQFPLFSIWELSNEQLQTI